MTSALLRFETPEEREYARYLGEIEVRKQRVAAARAEFEVLKSDLGRFEAEYHAKVGVLFVELDRVKLAIEEYERRIWWLQVHPEKTSEQIEHDVETSFAARRQEVEDEEQTTRQYKQRYQHERQHAQLAPDETAELKRRYRELAKRFHPDLARTEEERVRRETLMQQINGAFQERDLSALHHLEHESEISDPGFEERPIGEKLVWAIREVARLDDLIATLQRELFTMQRSSTFQLWNRAATGEGIFDQLVSEVEQELQRGRDRLSVLVTSYQQLTEDRQL